MPAAVVVTTRDTTVPVGRQRLLAERLPDVEVFSIDAGHDAVVAESGFAATLVAAIGSVVARAS